ncbi:NUDIX domain-containing protein [Nanoarchaeota archaeon]
MPGSRALIIDNNKILLIHRQKAGREYWVLPGGTIEKGETPEQTVIREVKEETNLDIDISKPLWEITDEISKNFYFKASSMTNETELGGPEAKINSPENNYELVWVTKREMTKLNILPKELKAHMIAKLGMSEVPPEIAKEFINALDKQNIHYSVIAGYGLDGKRGKLSRRHQDLDILIKKDDLEKLESILKELGYTGERQEDLYKVYRHDGAKIDIGLVTIEDDEAVTYGSLAITRFPKTMFENPQKGKIEDFTFNIAPNELLKNWGIQSKTEKDKAYAKFLPTNPEKTKLISRKIR